MTQGTSGPNDATPRNMVWVEDMPPDFTSRDYGLLSASYFTHAIVSFFHLDAGPTLVYNNPRNDPYQPFYDSWWAHLRSLKVAPNPKALFMSVGGWGSGTWEQAAGREAQGAVQIVKFAQSQGFDGIDFNFEGNYYPYTNERLAAFGRLVAEVRKIWNGLLTITPIYGQVSDQLTAIQDAAGRNVNSGGLLSWLNVQFYTYRDTVPQPMAEVPHDYELVLLNNQLPAGMVAAGFPLSETDLPFNQNELQVATSAVERILQAHPDFAGMFAWRFRGVFLGDRSGHPMSWAYHFYQILHNH